ncbi:MAG: VWA domain-containing protein [Bryobacterales bacterium]
MKFINYTKYLGDDFGISGEDLMRALQDFFLRSGFESQFMEFNEMNEQSLDQLQDAIRQALESGELFSEEQLQEMMERMNQMSAEQMQNLIDRLTEKLAEEGYVSIGEPGEAGERKVEKTGGGQLGEDNSRLNVRFEVTDKALDFLGYKTLKDLMGSLGKANLGSHDTREMATGVETSGSSKQYEFGDTFNLDVSATISNAIQREGLGGAALNLEYPDLMVRQSEYQSSCATVLMLDCSHSMILYGEDRFTPAKRVALALSHLIRTQYPGDSLNLVLFHDSAEEIPLSDLARVQVGPFYTNTREGLIVAQRILRRQRKDMRQIIMITDGKPSALTLEDGRIYKNPFGLDPLVISRTLEEVHKCKRGGVLINTFMLARDYAMVQFVQKITQICRGKAYFTTPYTLGQYLLMDYMNQKTRVVH